MIRANELRIGNWVEEEILGNVRVHEILHNSVWVVCEYMNVDRSIEERSCKLILSDIKPIPINPEILKKAGFEKSEDNFGGYLVDIGNDEKIRLVFDNIIGWNWPMFGNNPAITTYLHQLQNLYVALTGTELEIDL
jgi:hypothetical protein